MTVTRAIVVGARLRRLATTSRVLGALAVALGVAAGPSEAWALPPQAVAAGAFVGVWVALALGSVALLVASWLPFRVRRMARVLVVAVLVAGAFRAGVGKGRADRDGALAGAAPEALSAARVPDEVLRPDDAAPLVGDAGTLWVDLRRRHLHRKTHVRGAWNVPATEAPLDGRDRADIEAEVAAGVAAWLEGTAAVEAYLARRAAETSRQIPVPEVLERIRAVYEAAQPAPTRVALYHDTTHLAALLAHALRQAGVPAVRVEGGLGALMGARVPRAQPRSEGVKAPRRLTRRRAEGAAAREDPVWVTPTRLDAYRWARAVGAAPEPFAEARGQRPVYLVHRSQRGAELARFVAVLCLQWGLEPVLVDGARAGAPPGLQRVGLALEGALGARWYWVFVVLALALGLWSAWREVRWVAQADPRRAARVGRVAGAASLGVLVVAQLASHERYATPVAMDYDTPLAVIALACLGLGLALAERWRLPAWERRQRAADRLREALADPAIPPRDVLPAPMGLRHVAVAIVAAPLSLQLTWAALLTALASAWAGPCVWAAFGRRAAKARADVDGAVGVLRAAGLRARVSSERADAARTWVDGAPARAATPSGEPVPRLPDAVADAALSPLMRASVVLGRGVAGRVGAGGVVELTALRPPSSGASPGAPRRDAVLDAQAWAALRAALDAGHPMGPDLAQAPLDAARWDEAAPTATPLTVDLLARRSHPRAAGGAAARRFGARAGVPVLHTRVGARLYDAVPPASRRDARSGPLARLAVRAWVAVAADAWRHRVLPRSLARRGDRPAVEAAGARGLRRRLSALWGEAARFAEEAAWVAVAVRAHGAGTAEHATGAVEARPWVAASTGPAPYEVAPEARGEWAGVELREVPALTRRGVALAALADEAREAARGAYVSEVAAASAALGAWARRHEVSGVGGWRLSDLWAGLAGTREALERGRARAQALDGVLGAVAAVDGPVRWTLGALVEMDPASPDGFPVATAGTQGEALSGVAVGFSGGRDRSEGRVVHGPLGRPLAADEVLVVARLEPPDVPRADGAAGIVCETGNAMAHAAVLAREQGLPTVLGVHRALRRLPEGTQVRLTAAGGVEVVASATVGTSLLPLWADTAKDRAVAGGKASGLARAMAMGLAVPDTRVVPVEALSGVLDAELLAELARWGRAVDRGAGLAVRSSAVVEDAAGRSYAGLFESVVEVPSTSDALRQALTEVASGAGRLSADDAGGIAAVVQPMLSGPFGGVMETGLIDASEVRYAVSSEGPSAVVSGAAQVETGAIVLGSDSPGLSAAAATALARVAATVGPAQQVEWVWDGATLWVVQLRPAPEAGS